MEPADHSLTDRLAELLTRPALPATLVSAYLFGSRGTARSHRESDVDLGILLPWARYPAAADRFEARLDLIGWLQAELGSDPIDLVVLNDAAPGLARHIVNDGIRLVCRDPEADHAFRRDAMLRAADLEPFLRRARRIKLDALAE